MTTADDVDGRLSEFAALQPDWDSYGADPIRPEAIEIARKIAKQYPGAWLVPLCDGGVQLEWEGKPRFALKDGKTVSWCDHLEWEVAADGEQGYLLVFGTRRSERRLGVAPDLLPELLGRIGYARSV